MNIDKYTQLTFNVILLFLISILTSFIPELLPKVFFTEKCNGSYLTAENHLLIRHGCNFFDIHDPTIHWNWRHYLFTIMSFILFVIQSIKIINNINK